MTVVCNESPQADDDSATTDENTSVGIHVTANDTDSDGTINRETVTIIRNPDGGSVRVHQDSGVITYTPNLGNCDSDTFTYTIDDDDGATSNEATVTVSVLCTPPPLAIGDLYNAREGGTLDIPAVGILENDVDTPGSPLTAILISNTGHGKVSLKLNGAFTYIHDGSETSSDSFTYKANDGKKDSNVALVSIVIIPTNDPPVAQDDSGATDEDVPVTIDVLPNDSDPDGDTLSVDCVSQPANGTASNNGNDVTYTPGPDFYGADSFTYTASDGNGGTATATVRVSVATVNDPPVAQDDSDTTDEDMPVMVSVLSNDSDPDRDSLVVKSVTQPMNGTVSNNGNNVTYIPDTNFNGVDTFTYTASDGDDTSAPAIVTVTVRAMNDSPVAQDDTSVTNEDTPVSINVLANDSDLDGDSLVIQSSTQPLHGGTVRSGTSIIYTPDPNFNGEDTFMYTTSDGKGGTATATVTVTVTPVNDPPVAENDSDSTEEDTPVTILVLSNDTDPEGNTLVVESVTQPTNGKASNNGNNVIYAPASNFNGVDTFTYIASDGKGGTATATVTISVAIVNDPPVADDDSAATDEDAPVTISVLSNDSDPDRDSLVVESVTQPTNGKASNNGSSVTYIPDTDFNGTNTFTYTITDGKGGTAKAAVTVTVRAVNDSPVAEDDTSATNEDTPVSIAVLANDADPDGDSLLIQSSTQPLHGDTVRSGTSIIYTPAPTFNGTDTFTYTIKDGNGSTATATVTVTVIAVNDPPVAQDDSTAANEDAPVTIPVLANDTDPDGDSLAVESATQPANGTVFNNNGSDVTYMPDTGFSGIDTFSYTIADGKGATSTAKVIVAVSTTNDPPVAQDDSADTKEATIVTIPLLANDSDPDGDFLLVESFIKPAHGSVLNTRTAVSYIPDAGFSGVDTFSYTVSDGNGGTATATVTVSVAAVNDLPVAQDDSEITDEEIPVIIYVLLNDSDPDDDELTVESVNQPENGTVSNDGTNVTYTPKAGFSGIDIFDYTVSDGNGGTDTATIVVAVASVNNPPVAQNDSATTEKDTSVTISVLANDSDPDAGDSLVVESITQPASGTLTNNRFDLLYTPDDGFTGTDTFTYTISDGRGSTDTATVTVGVSGAAGAGGAADKTPCEGKVIISEVAWAGTASDPRDEWIELRNLGTTPVDLSGWFLRWRRTHPSTADDQVWKVVELSGIVAPASVSACDQALQDTAPGASFLKEKPEDLSWLVSSNPGETAGGYYVAERRHDATVSNVVANLLYDTSQSLRLDLSDLGDVIMLVNDLGEVVDTANASNLGRDGWTAGSATTYGTMERVDPLGADTSDNWQTNMGIVTDGLDARKHSLRATPGERNSPVLEDVYSSAGIEPTTVRSGETLKVDFLLSNQDRRTTGWPWISVIRPGFAGAAGAGGAAEQSGYSFSGRSEGGNHYFLDIGTKNLSPGEYVFWVIYGQGKALLVPVVVTP